MKKITKNAVLALAFTGIAGLPVFAGDAPGNTNEWVMQAEKAIDSVMRYPLMAERQGKSGSASFVVTINRSGDVVDYYNTGYEGSILFRPATARSLKRAEFPALPASYNKDRLSFSLKLDYITLMPLERIKDYYPKKKKGSVSGTQIALLQGISLSSGP